MRLKVRSLLSCLLLLLSAPMLLAQRRDGENARRISSWTSDRRDFQVGDVVTVLVSEATLASATKSQTGTDQQSRQNDIGITPPKVGTSALPNIDADMSTNKNSASKQNGDAKRGVTFRGDISVRVVKIDERTGLLEIRGTKAVDVDKNKQELRFSGWVRPEDINVQNLVPSERVADASLTYSLSGNLGKTRGGIIGRLITVFWP